MTDIAFRHLWAKFKESLKWANKNFIPFDDDGGDDMVKDFEEKVAAPVDKAWNTLEKEQKKRLLKHMYPKAKAVWEVPQSPTSKPLAQPLFKQRNLL